MCAAEGAARHDDAWRVLLTEAVALRGKAGVARELGVSRTAVSLLANGKYPGEARRMARRIEAVLGRRTCPQNGKQVSVAECLALRGEPMPTSSPAALRRWRMCQHCHFFQHTEAEDGR